MALFKSPREKRLWIYALVVTITIFSTLVIGRPLLEVLGNQNAQAIIFLLGMFLVGATLLVHGLCVSHNKIELAVWIR